MKIVLVLLRSEKKNDLNSSNEVQRSVESAFTIHILSVFSFQNNVYSAYIVAVDLLPLGSVETAETHRSHHVLFLR